MNRELLRKRIANLEKEVLENLEGSKHFTKEAPESALVYLANERIRTSLVGARWKAVDTALPSAIRVLSELSKLDPDSLRWAPNALKANDAFANTTFREHVRVLLEALREEAHQRTLMKAQDENDRASKSPQAAASWHAFEERPSTTKESIQRYFAIKCLEQRLSTVSIAKLDAIMAEPAELRSRLAGVPSRVDTGATTYLYDDARAVRRWSKILAKMGLSGAFDSSGRAK